VGHVKQRGPFSKEGSREGRPTNGAPSEEQGDITSRKGKALLMAFGSGDDEHMTQAAIQLSTQFGQSKSKRYRYPYVGRRFLWGCTAMVVTIMCRILILRGHSIYLQQPFGCGASLVGACTPSLRSKGRLICGCFIGVSVEHKVHAFMGTA
jgi:hypothetical protein